MCPRCSLLSMCYKGPLEPAAESAEVRATEQDEEEERYSVELILLDAE